MINFLKKKIEEKPLLNGMRSMTWDEWKEGQKQLHSPGHYDYIHPEVRRKLPDDNPPTSHE